MKPLFACLFLLFWPLTIYGQIETDRPDQTEASSVVPVNSLQIETGFTWENTGGGESKLFAGPSTLLRYGIFKTVEIRVFNQYEHHNFDNHKIDGMSDFEIGLKFRFFKSGNNHTEMALLSHVVIPSAKVGLSNQHWGTIGKLCISHVLNEWLGLGYNIGYSYLGETHNVPYSIAWSATITDKMGCYIEPFGTIGEGGSFESNFDVGITYLLKDNLQLDASWGIGLNHNMRYISLGLSWNFANVF